MTNQNVQTNRHGPQNKGCNQASADSKHYLVCKLRLEMTIKSLLYQVEKDRYSLVPVKALASVVGQIISLQNVIGKKVRLLTRQTYSCILSRASWNAPVRVTDEAKSD